MTIDEKLNLIIKLLNNLNERNTISQVTYFENLPHDAIVGTNYVAYCFRCPIKSVGRSFGTQHIPRIAGRKDRAYLRRDVDSIYRNLNKSVSEKAVKIQAGK